jgi:hypothetical protein
MCKQLSFIVLRLYFTKSRLVSTDNVLSLVFGVLGVLLAAGGIWVTVWVYRKYNPTTTTSKLLHFGRAILARTLIAVVALSFQGCEKPLVNV